MKVIDKRTKKINKDYKYGDILMCWDDDPDEYDVVRISSFYDAFYDKNRYIAVFIHDCYGVESRSWAGVFGSANDLVNNLTGHYCNVKKSKCTYYDYGLMKYNTQVQTYKGIKVPYWLWRYANND